MRHALVAVLLPVLMAACTGTVSGTGESATAADAADSTDAAARPVGTDGDERARGVSAAAPDTMPIDPAPPTQAGAPPMSDPQPAVGQTCNADAASGQVGQAATEATVERARTAAGARTVRVIPPDHMVTMDFIESRLNIDVDANNVIVGVRCG